MIQFILGLIAASCFYAVLSFVLFLRFYNSLPERSPPVEEAKEIIESKEQFCFWLTLTKEEIQQNPKAVTLRYYAIYKNKILYLYDDDTKDTCTSVIVVDHFKVSLIYPDDEYYLKDFPIILRNDKDQHFIYCDSALDKETLYFRLLNLKYAANPIVASGDCDWINFLLARVMMAKNSKHVRNLLFSQMQKKFNRMNKPSFLNEIRVKDIKIVGDPQISKIRMKDAQIRFTLNFRGFLQMILETELFNVKLYLSVTAKRLHGPVTAMIRRHPSNRMWMAFDTLPKMDLVIEPLVNDKHIKLSLLIQFIEKKLLEVIQENLVLPFMTDIEFCPSDGLGYAADADEIGDAILGSNVNGDNSLEKDKLDAKKSKAE